MTKEGYIPKEQRKKILLLTDDIRLPSGVGNVGREIVVHTSHHYNWVNIGAAINHPEAGKRLDLSHDTNQTAGISDASVMVYPNNGYGDANLIRQIMQIEKPDAIMMITDPRYFTWLFQIENEIRKKIPIIYLNIWDDYPAPYYNKAFYESCDALLGISKQTVNINKLVLGDKTKNKLVEYLPHGLDKNVFYPIPNKETNKEFQAFKKQALGGKDYEFILFFNSRNIRRKQIPDTILAFEQFTKKLTKEQAAKTAFLLHTQPVDENGTDLPAVIETLCSTDTNFIFTQGRLDPTQLNYLYNMADAQILLTSNEGWGLSLTEALLTGTPIIANVTGGMQDQMRFEFEDGTWIDFDADFPSNHRGTIRKHGKWAFPVYPSNISIVGSVPTPYIFDDRCSWEDAAERIMEVYSLSKEEREERGMAGYEWALSEEAGFTAQHQGSRFIEYTDKLFSTWKPREKYELVNANEYQKSKITHKLIY
jgi:glycosyltransferase involved in cell wall biosynthesis